MLDKYNQQMRTDFQSQLTGVLDDWTEAVRVFQTALTEVDDKVLAAVSEIAQELQKAILAYLEQHPDYQPVYDTVLAQVSRLSSALPVDNVPPPVSSLLTAVLTYTTISSLFAIGEAPPPSQPYPLKRYDPDAARAYFDERLLLVLQRGFQVSTTSLNFGLSLLQDKIKEARESTVVGLCTFPLP